MIHGVLHYLPAETARETVREALRRASRTVFIGEIPRVELKKESERIRRKSLPPGEYEKKYKGLAHTYFSQKFFETVSEELEFADRWSIQVFPESFLETVQNNQRFAVLFCRVSKKL